MNCNNNDKEEGHEDNDFLEMVTVMTKVMLLMVTVMKMTLMIRTRSRR